jgi:hypothetical protein
MNWYAKRAGNDAQGMVADEDTGRTVAVTYDHKDTALLAAAPDLLAALDYLLEQTVDCDLAYGIELTEGEHEARQMARAAIAKAKEE